MDEGAPKINKPLTKKEAGIKVIEESIIGAYQLLFTAMERLNPDIALQLKPHYDEFMQTSANLAAENPDGNWSIHDIEKRIPNNEWLRLVKTIGTTVVPEKVDSKDAEKFRQDVRKKMEGKDIK